MTRVDQHLTQHRDGGGPLRVTSVVGARPQFVKAAVVSRALGSLRSDDGPAIVETLVHTGQHYDHGMSQVFFEELGIPEPAVNLGVGSGPHGAQTGRMIEALEREFADKPPDVVLVFGDTNSTLAAALAAAKLQVPVAHVEAGLRSRNWRMPEEINRVLADRLSTVLFCPSQVSVDNLALEGIREGVHLVGDVMHDCTRFFSARAAAPRWFGELGLEVGRFALATVHRSETTDDPGNLRGVFDGLALVGTELPVVLPLHPRTRKALADCGIDADRPGLHLREPVSYLEMIWLEERAAVVLTDSGGVQKEAYYLGVPCVTLRNETEWVETVAAGWNRLAGSDPQAIRAAALAAGSRPESRPALYGDGQSSRRIASLLASELSRRVSRQSDSASRRQE